MEVIRYSISGLSILRCLVVGFGYAQPTKIMMSFLNHILGRAEVFPGYAQPTKIMEITLYRSLHCTLSGAEVLLASAPLSQRKL